MNYSRIEVDFLYKKKISWIEPPPRGDEGILDNPSLPRLRSPTFQAHPKEHDKENTEPNEAITSALTRPLT